MGRRYALTADQWERIKDLLPGLEGHVGVAARDNRLLRLARASRGISGGAFSGDMNATQQRPDGPTSPTLLHSTQQATAALCHRWSPLEVSGSQSRVVLNPSHAPSEASLRPSPDARRQRR